MMCTWDEFEVAKTKQKHHLTISKSIKLESSSNNDIGQSKGRAQCGTGGKRSKGHNRKLEAENLEYKPCNTWLVDDP